MFFAGLLMPIVTVSTLGSQLFAIVVGLAKGHVSLTFQDMLGRVLALSAIIKRAAVRRSGARHLQRGGEDKLQPGPALKRDAERFLGSGAGVAPLPAKRKSNTIQKIGLSTFTDGGPTPE